MAKYTITPREEIQEQAKQHSTLGGFVSSLRERLGMGRSLTQIAEERREPITPRVEEPPKKKYTVTPREEVEFYEGLSVDLTPEGDGFVISSPQMPQQIIKREDFTTEQEAVFNDLKAAREIEVKLEEPVRAGREAIPVYGALDIMGRGIAQAFNIRKATTEHEEALDRQIEAQNMIMEEINKARADGDGKKVSRLLGVLKQTDEISKPLIELVENEVDIAPTNQQVIGAASELALLSTLGIKTGIKAPALSANARASAKLAHYGTKYGLSSVKSGARIGLYSAATEMKIEDASVDDIIQAGERGAKVGLWLGPAFTATGDLIAGGLKKFAPVAQRFTKDSITKLEKIAAGKEKMPITPTEKALVGIEQPLTVTQKAAKTALSGIDAVKRTEQRLIDRFSPIRRIENQLAALKGRPLTEKEKVYRDIRMLQTSADGKSGVRIEGFYKKLNKFTPETQQNATGYLNLLDSIDRAQRGLKVPGDKTLPQLKKELAQFARFQGQEEMSKIGDIRRIVNHYTKHQLADDYKAGLISKIEMKRMLETHKNYLPHDVVMDKTSKYVASVGQSMDVSETTLKKAVGSVRDIKNPIDALINRTLITERVRQKNILMKNLFDAQKQNNVIPGAKLLKSGQKPAAGFDRVNFFEDGIKQSWQVPQNIGDAIKSTDIPIQPAWWNIITAPQRALKKGATTFNPGFVLRNKFRDEHQSALLANSFITEAAKKYGTSAKNAKNYTYKQLSQMYKREGGFGSSIFEDGEDVMRRTLMKGRVGSTFNYDNIKSLNPFEAIKKVNKAVEQSTRKEAMAKALAAGLNPKDATWVSRNATVDFSRMGTWMRPVNQAIPFLNARVQGLANLPKAFLANPDRFSEAVMTTAVMPTMLLHQHNRRYESYKYINQSIKDLDWVIMTGEIPSVNPYNGEEILVPQFITLKRGEGQNLVSAPIRHWLEKEDNIDHRKVSEMMADMFGSNSPVDFGTHSRQNFAGSLLSQLGPAVSSVVGSFSNKHPYFGSDIVPEYRKNLHQEMHFTGRTPEFLKQDIPKEFYRSGFAETLNISPAMIDFYVSTFGGMPQDVLKAVDIAYGVKRDGKMGGLNVTDTPWETLSELPVIRGFLKQSLNNVTEADRRLVSDVERDITTEDRMIKDRADEIVSELRTIKDPQKKKNYWNLMGDELTLELMVEVFNRSDARTTIEGLRATDRIDVRAKVIRIKIEEMKERGHSDNAIREYMDELMEAGILNKSVLEQL